MQPPSALVATARPACRQALPAGSSGGPQPHSLAASLRHAARCSKWRSDGVASGGPPQTHAACVHAGVQPLRCPATRPSPPPHPLSLRQGYGLFEVTASDELAQGSDAVQRSVESMERFGKVVKLSAFKPFTSAANALEQINAVSESQVGAGG